MRKYTVNALVRVSTVQEAPSAESALLQFKSEASEFYKDEVVDVILESVTTAIPLDEMEHVLRDDEVLAGVEKSPVFSGKAYINGELFKVTVHREDQDAATATYQGQRDF